MFYRYKSAFTNWIVQPYKRSAKRIESKCHDQSTASWLDRVYVSHPVTLSRHRRLKMLVVDDDCTVDR